MSCYRQRFFLSAMNSQPCLSTCKNKERLETAGCAGHWKIWWEMGRHMDMKEYFPWKTFVEAAQVLLQSAGYTCEELKKHPEGICKRSTRENSSNGFYTFSGKIEIYSQSLNQTDMIPCPHIMNPWRTSQAPLSSQNNIRSP